MIPFLKRAIQAGFWNNAHVQRGLLRVQLKGKTIRQYKNTLSSIRESRIAELRKKVEQGKYPLQVFFLVTDNTKWNVQSIWSAFDKSEFFDPTAVVFPERASYKTPHERQQSIDRNYDFFADRSMKVLKGLNTDGDYVDLKTLGPDLVFYEQPHKTLPDSLWVEQVSKYALTCYVPYGIITARIQQLQFNRQFHHRCGLIFCESELHKDLFAKYSDVGNENVVVTGHPKLDAYLEDESNAADDIWKLPRDKSGLCKRIIWAPHFSINNREVAYSTFHKYFRQMLEFARQTDNVEWLMKPHPWLRKACHNYGLMTESEFDSYMTDWNTLPNATTYEQGDYFGLFKTSDAMILDSVSFISEYMASRKPILFLINQEPPLVGFNEFGEQLDAGLYKARQWEDIVEFVRNVVLSGHDPLIGNRSRIVDELLIPMGNDAGRSALVYLQKELGLPSSHSDGN